ncbi:hypothetical protein Pcinc_038962 [Petrolisthes cinctipes]|uniref:Uncharacterized protein n=1 Tax=Petrolisthes cinctipes TaxID=88211 RepID=A0AAE1EME8_PETCI|nr:hypothetical protein Pcinc_038962 [Petrolisthes cinctipes]
MLRHYVLWLASREVTSTATYYKSRQLQIHCIIPFFALTKHVHSGQHVLQITAVLVVLAGLAVAVPAGPQPQGSYSPPPTPGYSAPRQGGYDLTAALVVLAGLAVAIPSDLYNAPGSHGQSGGYQVTYTADDYNGYVAEVSYYGEAQYPHEYGPAVTFAPQAYGSEPSYQAPQPSYQAPQPSYQAPQPSYQAPQPSYQPPQPSYQAPQPSYGPPQPSYN